MVFFFLKRWWLIVRLVEIHLRFLRWILRRCMILFCGSTFLRLCKSWNLVRFGMNRVWSSCGRLGLRSWLMGPLPKNFSYIGVWDTLILFFLLIYSDYGEFHVAFVRVHLENIYRGICISRIEISTYFTLMIWWCCGLLGILRMIIGLFKLWNASFLHRVLESICIKANW